MPGDPFLEKNLPSNPEAERSILGAILLDNAVCNQAIELLRREDFFLDSHRRIFDKMVALTERGMLIDLITLSDELRRAAEFEQIGGATYIASLIDGVPRTDTIEHYAKIVKAKAQLRRLITASNQTIADCFDEEEEPETIFGNHLQRVDEIRAVGPPDRSRVRLVTADELDNLPRIEWFIKGHLPKGGLTLLYGASGSYKSFYTLGLMMELSRIRCVVYVSAEGQTGYQKRVRAWRKHHDRDPGQIFFWLDSVNMLDGAAVNRFIAAIRSVSVDVVVLDTVSRCMPGGDENSSKDMTRFIESCERIQRQLGSAIWAIHHTGKNNQSERGHSSLRGAADVMIEIANDDGVLTIRCEKEKDEAPFESYRLRPVKVQLSDTQDSLVLLPANRVVAELAALTFHQRKLLETLDMDIFSEMGARYAQLKSSSGVPEGSIYRALDHLKKKGMIRQSDKGEPYFITDIGRLAVRPSDEQGCPTIFDHNSNPGEPSQPSLDYQGSDDGAASFFGHQPSSPSSPFRVMASDGDDSREAKRVEDKVWKWPS